MINSSLFDESTFYEQFIVDLGNCTKEVVIESPYITTGRMNMLMPIFKNLIEEGVKIYVMTRDLKEHDENMEIQSEGQSPNLKEWEFRFYFVLEIITESLPY